MDGVEQHGFSQGIFFRSSKGKNKATRYEEVVAKFFEGLGPPVETMGLRYDMYRVQQAQISEMIQTQKDEWCRDLVDQVDTFTREGKSSVDASEGLITPVAFVVTGLLEDENGQFMKELRQKVKIHSPHIASVSSKTHSSIKVTFQSMCQQLMAGQDVTVEDLNMSSEDDEEVHNEGSQFRKRSSVISANDLKMWYQSAARAPVVIIVEDADLLSCKVVQDILMSFSCIKIPVLFILGMSRCCETVDYYVPLKCPTTFVYKTFEISSSEDRLTEILLKVMDSKVCSVQFSGRVLRQITMACSDQELSMTRLESLLKICLLEHFRKPYSILCNTMPFLKEKILDSGSELSESVLATFSDLYERRAQSLKTKRIGRFNEAVSTASPRKTGRQSDMQLRTLEDGIVELKTRQKEWLTGIEIIYCMMKSMPGAPSQFTEFQQIYEVAWSGAIFKINEEDDEKDSPLDKAAKMLNMCARVELLGRLKKALEILRNAEDEESCDFEIDQTNIPYYTEKFEGLIKKLEDVEQQEKKCEEEQQSKQMKSKKMKFKSQVEFLQSMKESAEGSGQVFPKLRESIIKELVQFFKAFLQPLSDQWTAPAFIFDDIDSITQITAPASTKQIHAALVEPHRFFDCAECARDDGSHVLFDAALVYHLILEQSMLNVNISVIYENFEYMAKGNSVSNQLPKKRRPNATAEKEKFLARFRHALTELRHMGFIKYTKSRVHLDEVTRLNFGL